LDPAELTKITRQREEWAQQVVRDMAAGRTKEALTAFAERGLLLVGENREEARQALFQRWKEEGGVQAPQDHLIITGTVKETAILNRLAQREGQREGRVGTASLMVQGEPIHEGDRVLVTRNSVRYDIWNGDLGTVVSVDPQERSLRVRLDSGVRATLPLAYFDHLQLGYALTTHKGQGCTVEKAYILAGGAMQDRELSYVQTSRTRGETWIFADKVETGENIAHIARRMSVSHRKEMALELARETTAGPGLRDFHTLAQERSAREQQRSPEPEPLLTPGR